MQELIKVYGEPISIYTRAQAIEDGILVDVTEWASPREMRGGFNCPVAITRNLWAKVEAPKGSMQDTRGRAHDVLWMAGCATRGHKTDFLQGYEILFRVKLGRRLHRLWCKMDGDGVTIGFPEDF